MAQSRTEWRAQIDNELFQTSGRLEGQALKSAFGEVTRISHAEKMLTKRLSR